eukprot:symbB.v1.2.028118.t1/scaffold2945.1/size66705/9
MVNVACHLQLTQFPGVFIPSNVTVTRKLGRRLEPSKFLQQYFADVRQLARTGDNEIYTEEMINEVSSSWAPSEKELLTLVLRIENWAVESRTAGYLMQAETFRSIELLVRRFLAMAVDFVRSLAEAAEGFVENWTFAWDLSFCGVHGPLFVAAQESMFRAPK